MEASLQTCFYLDVTGAGAAEGAGELVADAYPELPFDLSLSFFACDCVAIDDELPDELLPPLAADAAVTAPEPAAGELLLLLTPL